MSAFDPKRTFSPEDVATQNGGRAPIPSIANPWCNRVLFGVVPALVEAMRRRDFIKAVAGSSVACSLPARAQQPAMPVIGWLSSGSRDTDDAFRLPPLRLGLN